MRILRIIATVDPRYGGPIEALKLSAAVMHELGHETEVVTLDPPDAPWLVEFPFDVHPQGKWFDRYGYTPRLAEWIAANRHRFDVAVIHGLWNHASIGGWQGSKRSGLPYVVFVHGMMDPWFKHEYPLKHWAKQAFWWVWQGKVLRDAGTVLFTSEEERRSAAGVFRGPAYRERVVAYGVAESGPERPGEADAFRKQVPKLGKRPFLLFMSRIHPKKGCDLLVQAFAGIAADFPEVDLVIAGPDQVGLRGELEALAGKMGIADRIHWPGMLSGDAKSGALHQMQAMILPSHQENFGVVVAEALACRHPVLISNRVNIWREVADAGAGFVAEDTLAGTVSLLRRFLALPERERIRMGDAALELYRNRFTSAAAAKDLESVLTQFTAKSNRMTT